MSKLQYLEIDDELIRRSECVSHLGHQVTRKTFIQMRTRKTESQSAVFMNLQPTMLQVLKLFTNIQFLQDLYYVSLPDDFSKAKNPAV